MPDGLGRRRQISFPPNATTTTTVTVKYRYDGAGVLRRVVSANSSTLAGDRLDFTYRADTVDAVGRIMFQEWVCPGGTGALGSACPSVTPGRKAVSSRYNRFSMLVHQTLNSLPLNEDFDYDRSGNMIYHKSGSDIHWYEIAFPGNRLLTDSVPGRAQNQQTRFLYDSNGSRLSEYTSNVLQGDEHKRLSYDALARTVGLRDRFHDNGVDPGECARFDADGNIVKTCDDSWEWLIYDGPNVAATLNDRWVFISGPAVDDPIVGLWRDPTAGSGLTREVYWVTDGAGRQFAAGTPDGDLSGIIGNAYVDHGGKFAGGAGNANTFNASRFEADQAPGFSYFRNRMYDQATGRWTQEDPMGLAGGLNLYQFNGNNPVTYTDPFGLCPWCIGGGIGAAVGAGGTLLYNFLNDRPLTEGLVRNTLVGAAVGAGLGAAYSLLASSPTAAAAGIAALPIVGSAQDKLARLGNQFGTTANQIVSTALTSGQRFIDHASKGNINVLIPRPDANSGFIRVTLEPRHGTGNLCRFDACEPGGQRYRKRAHDAH